MGGGSSSDRRKMRRLLERLGVPVKQNDEPVSANREEEKSSQQNSAPMSEGGKSGAVAFGLLEAAVYAVIGPIAMLSFAVPFAIHHWQRAERMRLVLSGLRLSPRLAIVITAVLAVCVALGEWSYSKPKAADKHVNLRLKHSSQQVVEVSNQSHDKETINLDNVALLVYGGQSNQESVRLVLAAEPPVQVDKPDAKTKYRTPTGYVQFPGAAVPGIEIANHSVVAYSDSYLFDTSKAPEHVVTVGDRRFRVRLVNIRDRSNTQEKLRLIEYTFGISEE